MEQRAEPYSYRNLGLWQKAQALALRVVKLTEGLPKTETARTIARQAVRSSGSIAANIAEGHGRFSVAAYRNHLSIARGSAAETDSCIDLLAKAGYISGEVAQDLHEQCDVLLGGLTRQMRSLEAKMVGAKPGTVREHPPEYVTDESPE